jgi:hypothetical protein
MTAVLMAASVIVQPDSSTSAVQTQNRNVNADTSVNHLPGCKQPGLPGWCLRISFPPPGFTPVDSGFCTTSRPICAPRGTVFDRKRGFSFQCMCSGQI